jgi:3-hydroxyacyl-CoA dehydrogenase
MSNVVKTFADLVVARLSGDDAKVKAIRIEKKAKSAFKSQIAATEAAIVDAEMHVEEALERFNNAVVPDGDITDGKSYVLGIQRAQEDLDVKQATLEDLKETLDYFNSLYKEKFGK